MPDSDDEQEPPMGQMGSANLVETFTGTGTVSIEIFLKSIDRAASLGKWNERQRIELAKLKLRGEAAEFLESHPTIETLHNWSEFKLILTNQYKRKISLAAATIELGQCMQKANERAADYATRIRNVGRNMVSPGATPEETVIRSTMLDQFLCAQFQRGLREGIRRFVLSKHPATLAEAIVQAAEEEQNESINAPRVQAVDVAPPARGTDQRSPRAPLVCKACKGTNHPTWKCFKHPRACWNCGDDSHVNADCKAPRDQPRRPAGSNPRGRGNRNTQPERREEASGSKN